MGIGVGSCASLAGIGSYSDCTSCPDATADQTTPLPPSDAGRDVVVVTYDGPTEDGMAPVGTGDDGPTSSGDDGSMGDDGAPTGDDGSGGNGDDAGDDGPTGGDASEAGASCGPTNTVTNC